MAATKLKSEKIETIFNKLIKNVKDIVKDNRHPNSVDLKLDATSIKVDSKGFLIWSKSKESTMQITLATQIPPYFEKNQRTK
jgi:hypothetical protein